MRCSRFPSLVVIVYQPGDRTPDSQFGAPCRPRDRAAGGQREGQAGFCALRGGQTCVAHRWPGIAPHVVVAALRFGRAGRGWFATRGRRDARFAQPGRRRGVEQKMAWPQNGVGSSRPSGIGVALRYCDAMYRMKK